MCIWFFWSTKVKYTNLLNRNCQWTFNILSYADENDILTSFLTFAGRITKFAFVSPQPSSPSSWASASIDAPSPWRRRRGESFNATAGKTTVWHGQQVNIYSILPNFTQFHSIVLNFTQTVETPPGTIATTGDSIRPASGPRGALIPAVLTVVPTRCRVRTRAPRPKWKRSTCLA